MEANRISGYFQFTDCRVHFIHDSVINAKSDTVLILFKNTVFIRKGIRRHFFHLVGQNVFIDILSALHVKCQGFRFLVRSRTKQNGKRVNVLRIQCLQNACRHNHLGIEFIRRRVYDVFILYFLNGINGAVAADKRKRVHRAFTASRANAVAVKAVRRIFHNVVAFFVRTIRSLTNLSVISHCITACDNRRAIHQRMT